MVLAQLNIPKTVMDHIEADIQAAEKELDDDAESIITNERYLYIASILKGCYKKKKSGGLTISDKIDRVVTNRIAALPIFAAVMILVYFVSITTVGTWATDWTNDGLFGDGYHLFGNGTAEYEEAITAYAEENLWTNEMVATVEDAAAAGVIGAEDILGAIEEADFGGFDEAYGSYADALAEAGYDISGYYDAAMENAPDTSEFGIWVPGIPALVESGLTAIGAADWLSSLVLDEPTGSPAWCWMVLWPAWAPCWALCPRCWCCSFSWPFWKPAATWPGWHLSWTAFSANSACPESPSSPC